MTDTAIEAHPRQFNKKTIGATFIGVGILICSLWVSGPIDENNDMRRGRRQIYFC